MRRFATVLGLMALAALASADVQLFFTAADAGNPWAPPGPADPMQPTAWNMMDYSADHYVPDFANFPTSFQPSTNAALNAIAYVWIRYTPDNGLPTENAKLQGLDLRLADADSGRLATGQFAYYIMDDSNGTGSKRWDTPQSWPPGFSGYVFNPQTLVAVTTRGIRNVGTDIPEQLYAGSTRTALLGAVRLDTPGTYVYELGPLGVSLNTGGTPAFEFGQLVVVPEPAATMALIIGILLIKRRR